MCIKVLTQYACGHARVEYMNRHCQCALIVGPVVEKRGRCGRRECGGQPREGDGGVEGRRRSEESRDGLDEEGEVERRESKVGM